MITVSKTHSEYPEAYDILNDGEKIGRIEIRWCFCSAWVGDREIYSIYNRDYWSGFNKHSERQLHIEKIKNIAQDIVLCVSQDTKCGGEVNEDG